MRSRTAKWFECAVSYDKTHEDGLTKRQLKGLLSMHFHFLKQRRVLLRK